MVTRQAGCAVFLAALAFALAALSGDPVIAVIATGCGLGFAGVAGWTMYGRSGG